PPSQRTCLLLSPGGSGPASEMPASRTGPPSGLASGGSPPVPTPPDPAVAPPASTAPPADVPPLPVVDLPPLAFEPPSTVPPAPASVLLPPVPASVATEPGEVPPFDSIAPPTEASGEPRRFELPPAPPPPVEPPSGEGFSLSLLQAASIVAE